MRKNKKNTVDFVSSECLKDITFIIKTFERRYCLARLLRSIRIYYKGAPILIADDSKRSCRLYMSLYAFLTNQRIEVIELPYDCGISYGRNELIKYVKTKYLVLLDDDYELDEKNDFEFSIRLMEEKGIDILGGYWREYPTLDSWRSLSFYCNQRKSGKEDQRNFFGTIKYDEQLKKLSVVAVIKEFPLFTYTDFVHNYFIAKTDSMKECSYDNDLKINEHIPFFYKAKLEGLVVAFSNKLSVMHKRIKLKKYGEKRDRRYFQVFMRKYGISCWETTYKNISEGDSVVYKYNLDVLRSGRDIYLFGAGNKCREILVNYDEKVTGIIDNNLEKRNTTVKNINVVHPDDIKMWKEIFIIITVIDYKSIWEQLECFGLTHAKDFVCYGEI